MNSPRTSHAIENLLAWESWAGAVRLNLIRMVAIALFYAQHLISVYGIRDTQFQVSFEVRIAILVISCGVVVAALYYVLRLGLLHSAIKYLVTAWDCLMIVAFIAVMGSPRGAFLMLFLLPIAASVLRLSLPLVYFATISAALAYLALVAYHTWFVVGNEVYYSDSSVRIPRREQVVVVLVFLSAGLLAGQAVRQVKRIVQSLSAAPKGES